MQHCLRVIALVLVASTLSSVSPAFSAAPAFLAARANSIGSTSSTSFATRQDDEALLKIRETVWRA